MLKAPFPYFGGKSTIAHIVWQALGDVEHYIEPFFGSGAVLLQRPHDYTNRTETVNDKDCLVANAWRAMKHDPEQTAYYADNPVNHADMEARRRYIAKNKDKVCELMLSDPEAYDAKIAGYWIYVMCLWIGPCSFEQKKMDGIPNLANKGIGIHKQIPHLANKGIGINTDNDIYHWFKQLSKRFKKVRVVCGDWHRVCGGDWQDNEWDTVGIFFDPPYSRKANRDKNIYNIDCLSVAQDVAKWCYERGKRENYRIVLAGYFQEHEWLLEHGWRAYRYKVQGGYSNPNKTNNNNRFLETLFLSPHCLLVNKEKQSHLFDKQNNIIVEDIECITIGQQ